MLDVLLLGCLNAPSASPFSTSPSNPSRQKRAAPLPVAPAEPPGSFSARGDQFTASISSPRLANDFLLEPFLSFSGVDLGLIPQNYFLPSSSCYGRCRPSVLLSHHAHPGLVVTLESTLLALLAIVGRAVVQRGHKDPFPVLHLELEEEVFILKIGRWPSICVWPSESRSVRRGWRIINREEQ